MFQNTESSELREKEQWCLQESARKIVPQVIIYCSPTAGQARKHGFRKNDALSHLFYFLKILQAKFNQCEHSLSFLKMSTLLFILGIR